MYAYLCKVIAGDDEMRGWRWVLISLLLVLLLLAVTACNPFAGIRTRISSSKYRWSGAIC